MKKQYKIQLPKGKKVTMTNVDFEDGVMTVNVELENRKEQKYEPKDGDFIFVESRLKPYVTKYSYIGIFHDIIKDDGFSTILLMYASLKDEGRLVCGNSIEPYINAEYIRPATEEEKKLLIDKLAEVGKKWNPGTKSIEDVRWRAGICCLYYYINLFGDVEYNKRLEIFDPETMYSDKDVRLIGYTDDNFYNSGNYFKTREAAENVAEQIRNIFKNSKSE